MAGPDLGVPDGDDLLPGNTPLVRIDGIFVKLECSNPGGSVKDRVAWHSRRPKLEGERCGARASTSRRALSGRPPLSLLIAASCLLLVAAAGARAGDGASSAGAEADVAAARSLFERNLEAIRAKDREAYLACYLQSEDLARVGPPGVQLGFASHEAQSRETSWPDVIDAQDLTLVPIRPGVVFGTYRYRVRYGAREARGLSERIFVGTPEGWRIAMTSAFPEPDSTPPVPRVLTGATLIDGTGSEPVPDAVVVIENGRIACAGTRQACPPPDGAAETALRGHWILPGLIDAHVHFSQSGWADARPDFADVRPVAPYERTIAALRDGASEWFRTYLCAGVTGVFDVGGYPWTLALPARAEGDTTAPHVVAAGPLLSTREFETINLPGERQILHMKDAATARGLVRYVAASGSSAVKVWWIDNPALPHEEAVARVEAAAGEARALSLPLIVHATTLERAKAAVRAGASMLVHGVSDQDVDAEFLALAREKDVVYCPTLTVGEGYSRLRDALVAGEEITAGDPLGCVDPATRRKLRTSASLGPEVLPERARTRSLPGRPRVAMTNLAKVRDAGITIAMGTDAGNPLTLHGASALFEMLAMQEAGLSQMEVIVASTRGSAQAAGRLGDLGTVERGKIADLIVLRASPLESLENLTTISHVVRAGVVREQKELRAPPE